MILSYMIVTMGIDFEWKFSMHEVVNQLCLVKVTFLLKMSHFSPKPFKVHIIAKLLYANKGAL